MAPIPTMGPEIPVILRSHNDGCGIHNSRRWGDHYGYGCDHYRGGVDRYPNANRDIDPRVGWQGKTGHPDKRHHTQRVYERAEAWHDTILLVQRERFMA